jgi:hypothetical protein
MYSTTSPAAKMVCEHIRWNPSMRAITAYQRGTTIYATGTLLKPNEWRELKGYDGATIGDCTLRVTRVPKGI